MRLKNRLIAITAAATLAGGLTPALAGNAGESLGACVDHVVDTCNANSKRPVLCPKGGIKACETRHSGKKKPTTATVMNQLKAAGVPAEPRATKRN